MLVGFATSDWSALADEDGRRTLGGAGYYRCELPARALRSAGHETVVGRLIFSRRHGVFGVAGWDDSVSWPDVVVLQRWMHEGLELDVLRARAANQQVANDVDDWFFGLPPSNAAFRATHPALSPGANLNHYRASIAASGRITASTPFLASKLGGRVRCPVSVARNQIDLDRWAPRSDEAGLHPVVGWVGATAWRSGDLETLRGLLGPLLEQHDLRFHHSGAHEECAAAGDLLGVAPERRSELPMAPIDDYPDLFAPIDVGLVPLSSRPFNHAKSCIKGMEYAAAGVPFVASDSPEYRWLRDEHGIGRVARRPGDWLRHLRELVDPDVRRAEATENRRRVESLKLDPAPWLAGLDLSVPVP